MTETEISASTGRTFAQTLAHHAVTRPDRRAVTAPGGVRSYAELVTDVARIASRLAEAGARPGDRVAIIARNDLAYVQLIYAASWAGVGLVCLNWRLARDEADAQLTDSAPVMVFAEREFADLVQEGRRTVWLDAEPGGSEFERWYADADPTTAPEPTHGQESVALVLYTTGTTGDAKGVQLVERNLRHMCEQATSAWLMHSDTRFLACLPLFHVSGMSSVACAIFKGGEVVVPVGTAVHEIGEAVQQRAVTHTVLVPTVLTSLVAARAAETYDLTSLEVLIYGSAPSGSTLIQEAMAMLPDTGFSQGYGLTETSAGVAIAPVYKLGDQGLHPGSVGRILANCRCRIVSIDAGEDVPAGEDGEIWLRTPQLTVGYLNKPEQTAAAIDSEGWFRTGDIGRFDDDGFLYIRDRLKDMIISGGENIYSVEVENAITAHPAVLENAVIGMPHPRWGETVKAVVVLRDGAVLDEEGLDAWLDGRLARYKRPRLVEFVSALPKTGSGKILKRALRQKESHDA